MCVVARADLIIKLVEAGSKGNMELFNKTVEALIAEERSKNHNILADKLTDVLRQNNKPKFFNNENKTNTLSLNKNNQTLFFETIPDINLRNLILEPKIKESINELIQEHFRRDLLRSYNLEPRNRIILAGPPGNGKTSLAEAISSELMIPFIVVRYEGIVDSYLGETSNKLNSLFEYARTRQCVLFFDEFDTIGKERGDTQETGEIKRVVSSLLLQIDRLPSHVIVITATNHPELLDRAVWRRFQLKLKLENPSKKQIGEWIDKFQRDNQMSLDYSKRTLVDNLEGLSFSNLHDFGLDIKRKYILSLPNSNVRNIVKDVLNGLKNQFSLTELRGEDVE